MSSSKLCTPHKNLTTFKPNVSHVPGQFTVYTGDVSVHPLSVYFIMKWVAASLSDVKYKLGLIKAENGCGWLNNENGQDDETGWCCCREKQEHLKLTELNLFTSLWRKVEIRVTIMYFWSLTPGGQQRCGSPYCFLPSSDLIQNRQRWWYLMCC